jgi:hypothetical protein
VVNFWASQKRNGTVSAASVLVLLDRSHVGDLGDLCAGARTIIESFSRTESALSRHRNNADIGDLKLFEPKAMCPVVAVRDCEGRRLG